MKRNVYYLSASDRINYGDILFPLIFKVYADKARIEINFYNYALVDSDLSLFGAFPTSSYLKFEEQIKKENGNIIIGGGEVLFASWEVLFSNINGVFKNLRKIKFYRKVSARLNFNKFIFSKPSNQFPYVPIKINENKIFYNAVGGSFTGNINDPNFEEIFRNLKMADYVSVRDQATSNNLQEKCIKSSIVPDSAILISDFFSIKYLEEKTLLEKSKLEDPYYIFQMGKYWAPEDLVGLAGNLKTLSKKLRAKIILCPIGLAYGHEDDKILALLSTYSPSFFLINPSSVFDIMYAIANSQGYMGTSLHGLITAQSFGLPFVPLSKKINKAKVYCEYWNSHNITSPLDFKDILIAKERFETWNYEAANESLLPQKKLVYENFQKIFAELQ